MTVKFAHRTLTPPGALPSYLPSVPVFNGEDKLDATKLGSEFVQSMAQVIKDRQWDAFGDLFDNNAFWKDVLTLTFDKRTLHGSKPIADAWKTTSEARKPTIRTDLSGYGVAVAATFHRMTPSLASLDVPFCMKLENPKTECIGIVKLIPRQRNTWKIWVMHTIFVSLTDHPFQKLPLTNSSLIPDSQKGQPLAQGLPNLLNKSSLFDAVVVGLGVAGVACTIQLHSIGTNVIAFDKVSHAGGAWSGPGKAWVTLHHQPAMSALPQYDVPSNSPADMHGPRFAKYMSEAVKTLKLPVFCGVNVVSNTYDKNTELWEIQIEDVKTGERSSVTAKNLVSCMGTITSPANHWVPPLRDRNLFKGPVQHSCQYKDAGPYRGKKVVVVGAANSAHDVARDLVDGGAGTVTILQRGPTSFFEWEKFKPVMESVYGLGLDLRTADFLYGVLPMGIICHVAREMGAEVEEKQQEFYERLERKGYSVQRNYDMMVKFFEDRASGFFMDRQKTLELVFNDRIKVARGTAVGYSERGIVVNDGEGGEKHMEAEGVVLATGFEDIDLKQRWIDTGFLKSELASGLQNPCTMDLDQEGELIGLFTDSGHPHLYLASFNAVAHRWVSTIIAAQIMADIKGEFPARLPRTSESD